MSYLTSITQINLTPSADKKYWRIEREWREEFIYFLLVDRFHDDKERTPTSDEPSKTSFDKLSRFCGGTLKGIRQHLDYIQGLGCTALWISPVFENNDAPDPNSNRYHGYAIQNYLDIDPRFGTIQDLKDLVKDAHAREMRVFLDIVLNHSGNNWYYEGEKHEGPYYYHRDRRYPFGGWNREDRPLPIELRDPDLYHRCGQIRDGHFDYYPETQRGDFYDLRDFNDDEDPEGLRLQDILIQVHCHWLRETDVDGFRLDAAKHKQPMAVARFCSSLHEYAYRLGKNQLFLFGELTSEDAAIDRYIGPNTSSYQTIYHGLDSVVDYPLFNAGLPNVIKGHEDPEKLFKRYETLKYHALDRSEWGEYLVTFLDNHDQWQRFAWDADEEKHCDDKQVIAGIGYLLCAVGTACIYYGTEQGFSGHGDKFELVREPLFDLAKDDTSYLNTDCQIYREIAQIAKIHQETPALRFGRMYFRQTSRDKYKDPFALPQKQPFTLAFSRVLMDQEVLVAYNTSTKDPLNDWVIVDSKLRYRDGKMRFLYGKEGEIAVEKHPDLNNHSLCVQLKLEPMQFVILINQW